MAIDKRKQVDPDIVYQGKAITLPGDPNKMPLKQAIETLQRKAADEEQPTNVMEWIDVFPMDGAVAFNKAMVAIYGWASPVPTPGFFGPTPPAMISVRTGPNNEDVVQVPWGAFKLPNVEGTLNTGAAKNAGRMQFVIHGTIKKKDHEVVLELARKTREILATQSIYKGKAIRLKVEDDGSLNQKEGPDFIPVSHVKVDELILNPGEGEQIETALWTPIRNTALCLKHQIPLKRGVLLEGPYGCGKSMTATVTSKIATDNGWTFIVLDRVQGLKEALLFAKRYSPAVVFAEDIDRALEKRTEAGNDLLNVIDGVLSKDSQVITVLTTNFVEKLDKAMLRPGRLDAVISVRAPEANAVRKLVNIYARNLMAPGEDLTALGEELAGNIPATIREVVERSKLAMIGRGGDHVSAADLLLSARGMKKHLELLQPKVPALTPGEALREALVNALGIPEGMRNGEWAKLVQKTDEVHKSLMD